MQKQIRHIIVLFLVALSLPMFSRAADIAGFSAMPAVVRVSVAPAGVFRSALLIKNTEHEPLRVTLRAVDFVPEDDRGGVRELATSTKDDPVMASGWVSLPAGELSIPPKKSLTVPFSIVAPDNANPGGKSVAIAVERKGENVSTRMYVLCFISVPGNAKDDLRVVDFSKHAFIGADAAGIFHVELKNMGDTHARPEGEIVVRNMFGAVRARFALLGKQAIGTLVPGAKRGVDYGWRAKLGLLDFGIWNAKLTLNYGGNMDHVVGDRAFFLVLPWRALLCLLLVLGGAIAFFLRSMRRMRAELAALPDELSDEAARAISLRLLAIPFIAGVLLLAVVAGTLFSVLAAEDGGVEFTKIEGR